MLVCWCVGLLACCVAGVLLMLWLFVLRPRCSLFVDWWWWCAFGVWSIVYVVDCGVLLVRLLVGVCCWLVVYLFVTCY